MAARLKMVRAPGQRGAAAVEFALISITFFAFVIGLLEYGWYFYVAQNTSGAVGTVTRKLQVGDCWTGTDAYTFAHGQSGQITALTKSPNQATAPAPGTTISITVTANASLVNFIPVPNGGVVTRTVTAQMEDDVATSC
jgi:Flp pilus assembly protein TadG